MTTDRTPASPVEVPDNRLCGYQFATGGYRCLAFPDHPVHNGKWVGREPNHDFEFMERRTGKSDRRAALQAQDHTITKGGLDDAWQQMSDAATSGPWEDDGEYVVAEGRHIADVRYKNGKADRALIVAAVNHVRAALEPTHD